MIRKFLIIIVLTLFMVSVAYASDVDDDSVNMDNEEIQILDFIEVNKLDFEESNLEDVVDNNIISEDEIAPVKSNQEYNDSYIIDESKNYHKIENYQHNCSFINETLDNDTDLEFNNITITVSIHIFNNFFSKHDVFICMNLDSSFKTMDFSHNLSKFKQIDKFNVLTYDLIFYNDYCNFLIHDVDVDMLISSDKLHTDYAFSIDNSIIGSNSNSIYNILSSNFSSFQTFSNFDQIFIINYNKLFFRVNN
ncbi:MAG: hypothetical protein IJ104_04250 [Methanobrevibacter sp.]|nr:hypothetical protein [Methanobrevibacter sp.]